MRTNIYAEELTDRFEVVERMPWTGDTDYEFYGLRFYLRSPHELHSGLDTSAVTVWFADKSAMSGWLDKMRDAIYRQLAA